MNTQLNSFRSGLIVVLLAVALMCQAAAGDTIYVDRMAPGSNDGTSWRNAYHSLQSALAVAAYGDEIRVGQNNYYYPTYYIGGERTVSFQLVNGVTLRGGYAGFREADPNARDIILYATILNGDIGAGDDDSYHVVNGSYTDPNTVLDGFIITNGNADGSNPNDLGGGMYNYQGNPTVSNCTFIANSSIRGGGMFNEASSPTITNCRFLGNVASDDAGGIYNAVDSHPIVTNCIFSGNSSSDKGGGIYNTVNSDPSITNCTFSNNSAGYGGGICCWYDSDPSVANCVFWGNTAVFGAQIGVSNNSHLAINCSDLDAGIGGIWASGGGTVHDGGGNLQQDPLFFNADGPDNTAGTVDDNLRLSSSLSPCIDSGDNNAVNLPPTDLAGDPRVTDGDDNGTAVVDMGAFEDRYRRVHNITQDLWYEIIQQAIDGADNGDQIEVGPGYYHAIDFLGKSIAVRSNSSNPNDTVIYHGARCENGEDPNTILEGLTITGGGMHNSQSSPTVTRCIFSGNFSGGMHNSQSSPTVTHCTFSGNTASYTGGGMYNVVSSPKVTYCIFSGNSTDEKGGGMCNYLSNPIVTHCTFSGNSAKYLGGGMLNELSSPTVTHCTFSSNFLEQSSPYGYSDYLGGSAMCNYQSSNPAVSHCVFSGNHSLGTTNGGGMCNYQSSPIVTNCIFSGNFISGNGGGMCNCLSSNPIVTNCIFSGNFSHGCGGGMCNAYDSVLKVTNCILWGNTAPNGPEIHNDGTSTPAVTYSDVQGSWAGDGNIDEDPLFFAPNGADEIIGTEDDNFRLSSGSPCIDAGDNSLVTQATDIDGLTRIVDGNCDSTATVDMGAYEFDLAFFGDCSGDCVINLVDFAILSDRWTENPCNDGNNYCDKADIDRSGNIDMSDLLIMTKYWLQSVGP